MEQHELTIAYCNESMEYEFRLRCVSDNQPYRLRTRIKRYARQYENRFDTDWRADMETLDRIVSEVWDATLANIKEGA